MKKQTIFQNGTNQEMKDKYADMLNLPHPVSKHHLQMPLIDRAAQFAPFAALTGHGEAVKETARMTDRRIDLDENYQEILDTKLQMIRFSVGENSIFSFTYFLPDERKEGGEYVTVSGSVKKIDEYKNTIVLTDGTSIPIDDILDVEGRSLM